MEARKLFIRNAAAVLKAFDNLIFHTAHDSNILGKDANIIRSSRGVRSSTAIFQFVMGAIFIAWGFTDLERLKFLLVLGAGFIAYGGYWLFLARTLKKPNPKL